MKTPKEGERDNEAWASARAAAKEGINNWVKVVWSRGRYLVRAAQPGYAPDPDWSKYPTCPISPVMRRRYGGKRLLICRRPVSYWRLYAYHRNVLFCGSPPAASQCGICGWSGGERRRQVESALARLRSHGGDGQKSWPRSQTQPDGQERLREAQGFAHRRLGGSP